MTWLILIVIIFAGIMLADDTYKMPDKPREKPRVALRGDEEVGWFVFNDGSQNYEQFMEWASKNDPYWDK